MMIFSINSNKNVTAAKRSGKGMGKMNIVLLAGLTLTIIGCIDTWASKNRSLEHIAISLVIKIVGMGLFFYEIGKII